MVEKKFFDRNCSKDNVEELKVWICATAPPPSLLEKEGEVKIITEKPCLRDNEAVSNRNPKKTIR
jgi:hypothetical protein